MPSNLEIICARAVADLALAENGTDVLAIVTQALDAVAPHEREFANAILQDAVREWRDLRPP